VAVLSLEGGELVEGTADPEQAIRTLKRQGYDLHQPSAVPVDKETAGPFPVVPDSAEPL
jgi:DNA-binding winged helix-turn-helix (wHTH) protein